MLLLPALLYDRSVKQRPGCRQRNTQASGTSKATTVDIEKGLKLRSRKNLAFLKETVAHPPIRPTPRKLAERSECICTFDEGTIVLIGQS
jgi:hypothetical protein